MSKAGRSPSREDTESHMKSALLNDIEVCFSLIENVPYGVVLTDKDGKCIYMNPEFMTITGYTMHDIPSGRHWLRKAYPDRKSREQALDYWRVSLTRKKSERVMSVTCRDGTVKDMLIRPVMLDDGRIFAVLSDVTEQKLNERKLHSAFKTFYDMIETAPIGVFIINEDGGIQYVNPAMCKISGMTGKKFLAMNVFVISEYIKTGLTEKIRRGLQGKRFRVNSLEIQGNKRKNTIRNFIGTPFEQDGERKLLMFVEDITEQKLNEEKLIHIATHDALTGLPNRLLFNDRLQFALAYAQRRRENVAVMLLDLDRFKDVNDTLGHSVGDVLLQAVSDRLSEILRKSDTVARMGGDEFLMLLPNIQTREDTDNVAAKILEVFDTPFRIDNHEIKVSTSIGIAVYPENGEDIDALVKNADAAMYDVKKTGRNGFGRFSELSGDT